MINLNMGVGLAGTGGAAGRVCRRRDAARLRRDFQDDEDSAGQLRDPPRFLTYLTLSGGAVPGARLGQQVN